jgi:PleD family two-component response regulator
MMPIVDGFGVLKQIKQDPMLSNLIVIILTNLADEKTAEEIYKLGATEYLIKSELTPLEVAVRVKELISYYKKDQLKK